MTPPPALILAIIEFLAGLLKPVFHAPSSGSHDDHSPWKHIPVALLLAVQLMCGTAIAILTNHQYSTCGVPVKIGVMSLFVLNLCTFVSEAAASLTILSLPRPAIVYNHLARFALYVIVTLCVVLSPIPFAHFYGVRVFDHPLDCSQLDNTDALAVMGLVFVAVPITRSPSIPSILLSREFDNLLCHDLSWLALLQVSFWPFMTDITSSLLLYNALLLMLLPSINHLITHFRLVSTYPHIFS